MSPASGINNKFKKLFLKNIRVLGICEWIQCLNLFQLDYHWDLHSNFNILNKYILTRLKTFYINFYLIFLLFLTVGWSCNKYHNIVFQKLATIPFIL